MKLSRLKQMPHKDPGFSSEVDLVMSVPEILRRQQVITALQRMKKAAEEFEAFGFKVTLTIKEKI